MRSQQHGGPESYQLDETIRREANPSMRAKRSGHSGSPADQAGDVHRMIVAVQKLLMNRFWLLRGTHRPVSLN